MNGRQKKKTGSEKYCTVFLPDMKKRQPVPRSGGSPETARSAKYAEETVFIGDSVRNLQGAAEPGILQILIAADPAADVETDYLKIHDLREPIRQKGKMKTVL